MKKVIPKIAISVVVIAVIACIIYQVRAAYNPKIITEKAIKYKYTDVESFESFVVRNEKILTCDREGVRSYAVANGTKVAQNSAVLNIYTSDGQATLASEIDSLDNQIRAMSELDNSSVVAVGELDSVNGQLKEQMSALYKSIRSGDLSTLSESKNNISAILNKKSLVLGEENDFSKRVKELKSEREKLKAKLTDAPYVYRSPASGYFVSAVDGYENILSSDKPEEITPDVLDSAMKTSPKKADANTIGKLSTGFSWYIAFNADGKALKKLEDKSTVNVNIPSASLFGVAMPVYAVNYSSDGKRATVILECNLMSVELSSLRMPEIQVVFDEKQGTRIPTSAIHVTTNKKGESIDGVYVVFGRKMSFKKIDIIFDGGDYVICSESKATDCLREGDNVVTSGKDLYDGKFIG